VRCKKFKPNAALYLLLTKPGEGIDATGLIAKEGRSASAALTAGLSITWQQWHAYAAI
jgi:hypothetical protein